MTEPNYSGIRTSWFIAESSTLAYSFLTLLPNCSDGFLIRVHKSRLESQATISSDHVNNARRRGRQSFSPGPLRGYLESQGTSQRLSSVAGKLSPGSKELCKFSQILQGTKYIWLPANAFVEADVCLS